MAKIKLLNLDGTSSNDVEIADSSLLPEIHEQALFDVVIAEKNAQRQGTHSTLTKAEVRGGGRKPWKQKHTGKARQGSIRAPQWVGGGIVFGPKPGRNYTNKVNKKVANLALKSALTAKVKENSIYALVDDKMDKANTRTVVSLITTAINNSKKRILLVANEDNGYMVKSALNLPKVESKMWNQTSVTDITKADYVIIQKTALNKLMEVVK